MYDETTYWMNLPLTQREKVREAIQRKEYRNFIRELTSVPLTKQVQAENLYLRSENQMFHNRISRNGTFLYPIPPDNFRILYKQALKLSEEQRSWMTMISFPALKLAAENYAENPPQPKSNQISIEAEQILIDMATENILWGAPHLQYAMWNIGYDKLKESQVYSVLKRNNIPTTLHRRTKGIDWNCFLACMDILLEDENTPDAKINCNPRRNLPNNPYRKWHTRLVDFYRNATIDPEDMVLNQYLRTENMILSGIYFRNHKELQLTQEEKVALAKTASEIRGPNRDKMPLLSPAEIVRYAKKQAGKKDGHKSPKREIMHTHEETKNEVVYNYENLKAFIKGYSKDHKDCTRKEVWRESKKHFNHDISQRTINDLMYELKLFQKSSTRNGIPWNEFKKHYAGVTWAGDFFLYMYGVNTGS